MSTITCNEEIKSHPLGDLGVTYTVHLYIWLVEKRVVNFLLVLIEFFWLALMAAALTIKRNLSKSAFSEGVGQFECKFLVDGDVARNPAKDL